MKTWILILCLIIGLSYANFDFTHHKNGHELLVTLKDETSLIWVVYVFANDATVDGLVDKNRNTMNLVKQRLYNQGANYTEVDLTTQAKKDAYREFTDMIGITKKAQPQDDGTLPPADPKVLKEGPIVVLVHNKKGYWISGHGIPQETIDIVHAFLVQKQTEAAKQKPVNVGGTGTAKVHSFSAGY